MPRRTPGCGVDHRTLVRPPGVDHRPRGSPLLVISNGEDLRVARILAAGARGLALDPAADVDAVFDRPVRVCVASYEVIGPTRNGGIGTASTSLAQALARAGHDVTLLFTGQAEHDTEALEIRWRESYARERVHFEIFGKSWAPSVHVPHYNARRAYELYCWLREQDEHDPFDIVHFPECQGHAYYALLARRHGLAFRNTLFVAGVHSSTRWCVEANRELPRSIDGLVDEQLERRSVELADVLISPSAYMIDYMEERGWKLPERCFVQQYVLPQTAQRQPRVGSASRGARPDELVFFGRLEVRKGIEAFCDALDRLADDESGHELKLTFLGRPEHVLGEPAVDYVARRARHWPWPYEIRGDLDQPQAMAYLRTRNCVAVMPSMVDNSPNTVAETLSLGVPLVTSRAGGTGELIDPLDIASCTFPGLDPPSFLAPPPAWEPLGGMSSDVLADRLREALSGQIPPPRFAIDHAANECFHVGWHVGAAAAQRDRTPGTGGRPATQLSLPTVTVGVIHRNDPELLQASLEALADQEDQLLDVVVVDDGSDGPEVLARFEEVVNFARLRDWAVLRRSSPHVARAYELTVSHAQGDLLVLLRSHHRLRPGALQTLRELAAKGPDIISWAVLDEAEEGTTPSTWKLFVPLDGPPLVGLLYPAFAIGGFAITRHALDRVGGFAPECRGDDAEQDLLNRALLAGLPLELVPDPLTVMQRRDAWTEVRSAVSIDLAAYRQDREEQLRVARAFRAPRSPGIAELPGLYLTLAHKTASDRTKSAEVRQAEYIAYLEGEHHLLSDAVHSLQRELARTPYRRLRRVVAKARALRIRTL